MIEKNQSYEIGFLAKSDSDKEELEEFIRGNQFSVVDAGQMTKIKLNYPVKKENFAYFGNIRFSGDPDNIKKLNEKLRTGSKILRFSVFLSPAGSESNKQKKPEEASLNEEKISSAYHRTKKESSSRASGSQLSKKAPKTEILSNEALEKKLEEILQ